eukprot:gene22667-9117_t
MVAMGTMAAMGTTPCSMYLHHHHVSMYVYLKFRVSPTIFGCFVDHDKPLTIISLGPISKSTLTVNNAHTNQSVSTQRTPFSHLDPEDDAFVRKVLNVLEKTQPQA